MDDYSLSSLVESKNEWCSRLINILTPCIIQGLKSIFDEAYNLCVEQEDEEKYLMTFQNFLSRIPRWNTTIISEEVNRIIEKSGCGYLEDLITCVHIVQLKALTVSRVGTKQKKIDLDIPSKDLFIHKCYVNIARKVYTNIYLFERGIEPLQIQKNNRELETIIKEMILNTVRENIPVELILKSYLDETEELDVTVEEKKELIPLKSETVSSSVVAELEETKKEDIKEDKKEDNTENKDSITLSIEEKEKDEPEIVLEPLEKPKTTELSFSDKDITVDQEGKQEVIEAPKTLERLEEISKINNEKRKAEEEEEEKNDEDAPLNFGDDITLDLGIENLSIDLKPSNDILLKDIEVL
jgi:hypothetical protein